MEGEAKGGSIESGSRKRDKLDSDGAKRGSSRTTNSGSIMYKFLRLKQALETKIGRTIEKEMGLKQTERDSIIVLVGQGRRRLKDHVEEFALALKTSLLLPEVDEGEKKQFVEAKIQEFVSDLSGLRMVKEDQGEEEQEMMCGGEEQVAAAAGRPKTEELEEFLERRRKVGVELQTADDFLERSRNVEVQTGEKELDNRRIMDKGEEKQFVEAKIKDFVSDLSRQRMEKIGKEEDEGGEMQEAEVPEFIRGFKVGVPRAEDCLERSRKVKLQTAEKEFLERHGNCKAVVEGAVVLEEEGPTDHLATEIDEESFAGYREGWEITWGNGHGHSFENLTLLSSMLFTHCTPGSIPMDAVVGKTFQVYSVRVMETKGFKWPLNVYGVVAARDEVDKHRNPLFLRSREDCQILYKEDSCLHLTGPCRAIVSHEPVDIEIQLRVKGAKKSEDRPLMSHVFTFRGEYCHHLRSSLVDNRICTIELSYQQLKESVQATIFGVHVAEPSSFEFGVRVVCSSLSQDPQEVVGSEYQEVVLFDSKYGEMPMGNGYLNLSRQVVSVELQGLLRVHIQAYTPSGGIAACGVVFVTPKTCNTSQHRCVVGDSIVEFTVAWSLLVEDEMLVLMKGCVDPYEVLPPMHPDVERILGLSESSWSYKDC